MQTISNGDKNRLEAYSPIHLHIYVGGALIPCELGSFKMTAAVGGEAITCGNSVSNTIVFQSVADTIIRILSTHDNKTLTTHDSKVLVAHFNWKKLNGIAIKATWDVDGSTEYDLFNGKIEKTEVSGGKATITAHDELFWNGSSLWNNQASYQTDVSASTVLNSIASTMGVSVESGTSTLASSVTVLGGFSSCRDTLTCYQAVGYIAGILGGNAVIDRSGKLKVVRYGTVSFTSEPYQGECSAEDENYTVTGLTFNRTYTYTVTNTDGTVSESEEVTSYVAGDGAIVLENPIADLTGVQRAYTALSSVAVRKGTFSFPMGIQLEPGDVITITSANGNYPVAINQIEFSIDGGVKSTVQGGGQLHPGEEMVGGTPTAPGRAGPLTQRVESLELELLKVKNLQAENAEITNANIQSLHAGNIDVDQLFAKDITATGSFSIDNDGVSMGIDTNGFALRWKESNGYSWARLDNDLISFARTMESGEFGNNPPYITFGGGSDLGGGKMYLSAGDINLLSGYTPTEMFISADTMHLTGSYFPNQYGYRYGTVSVEGTVIPETTGVHNIGSSSARWNYIYLAHNPNVSSDRNVKRDITEEVPDIVDKLVPVSYKRKGGSDRIHYGFIAQDVEQALLDSNVDTNDIGLVTYDTDSNGAKKNYALSYDELIPILVAKIQSQQKQIDSLAERLDRLEKGVK